MRKRINITQKDWDFFKAALLIYTLEPFQSHAMKDMIKELLEKYEK